VKKYYITALALLPISSYSFTTSDLRNVDITIIPNWKDHAKTTMFFWPVEYIKMKQHVRASRTKLERLRLLLLKSQIQNAYANVPYYHDSFKRRGIDPCRFKRIEELADYPVLTRSDIQTYETSLLSKTPGCGKMRQSFSSGTTGRPLRVSFDADTWFRKKYLSKLRSRIECGLGLNEKVAIFETDPPEKLARQNKRQILLTPLIRARFFSIYNDRQKQVDEILRWRPQNVYSPPGHLFELAHEIAAGGFKPGFFKRIFTSSEYLEPNMRHYIQKQFNAPVFDVYGCTETKEIAWECDRHDGYHINEDEVYVEILDGEETAAPGAIGDIVLTDLRNKAMPLIRYRIGDRGMLLPGQCRCGRVFKRMIPVAGRSSDFIITPAGEKVSPYRLTTAIENINGLLQYQFIQEDAGSITVKVIMAGHMDQNKKEEIINTVRASGIGPMHVRVQLCSNIEIEENGKYKVVKSRVLELKEATNNGH
jgi:phenylacetate-CoA ligase